ncbi:hypothetical protein IG206_01375 [Candidatus Parvarchaeota archaeon]|jgi:uncharacterized protein YqfA (UPF0365 family)|nr:hypothetical protein [Candidatus Acidifodinimicrobium mancum]
MIASSKKGVAGYIMMIIIVVAIMLIVLIVYLTVFSPGLWKSLLPGVPTLPYL